MEGSQASEGLLIVNAGHQIIVVVPVDALRNFFIVSLFCEIYQRRVVLELALPPAAPDLRVGLD
jgi:hypothetical protein